MYHETVSKIETLLTESNCNYKKFEHEEVRTSFEANAVRPEYTLAQGAKALIVRVKKNGGKSFAMVVVPGDKKFDTKKVREALDAKDIRFATEDEVSEITNGVKPGGVPPFGNLWGLPMLCDQGVFENDTIIFNAGDRRVSIAVEVEEYRKVVQPQVEDVTSL
mgnify:CR=1 FL=1